MGDMWERLGMDPDDKSTWNPDRGKSFVLHLVSFMTLHHFQVFSSYFAKAT